MPFLGWLGTFLPLYLVKLEFMLGDAMSRMFEVTPVAIPDTTVDVVSKWNILKLDMKKWILVGSI